jgi:cyanophycin synthetase
LNLFEFKDFNVMLDYAHNAAGLRALADLIGKMEGYPKVGIIAGVGDRRDEDTIALGAIAAGMFDEIIIRQDRNLRGREEDELIALLEKGIDQVDPKKPRQVIRLEKDAIAYAIQNVKKGSLIVVSSDVVPDALNLMMKYKEEESEKLYHFNVEDIKQNNSTPAASKKEIEAEK